MTIQLDTQEGASGPGIAPDGRGTVSAAPRRRRNPDSVWRLFIRKPTTLVYLTLLTVMVLLAIVGPLLAGDPVATGNPVLLAPGGEFLLGTDHLGRDFLARLLYGGQISLLVGFAVAFLCLTLALVIGGLAGFYGGVLDTVLVKVMEFFQVVPGLVLALVAAALLGSDVTIIVIILAVTMWPGVGRIVRGEAMRIAELGYVESARAAGFSGLRILWSDVLPNAMPPILVATTMTVARAILLESGLSFLGIGDANRPSWGALLSSAQMYMSTGWWLAFFPGLCIFIVVLSINMLGDLLSDALTPTIGRVK
jgi:peptide/nickel transport system permease protein